MTKSLKGLSGRATIFTTEEFISGRQTAFIVQPVALLAAESAIADGPAHSEVPQRIPTWTIKQAPDPEFCPIGEDHDHGKVSHVTDGGATARGWDGDLVIPGFIMDEGVVALTAPGTASGVIDFDGDTDDFTITLTAGTTYLISMRGTGANALTDPFLQLLDAGLVEVKHDDDGGNGTNSLITFAATATGTYTIRAASFNNGGNDVGGYTVDVRVQGADSVGDTNATAVVLNQGTTFGFRETGTGAPNPNAGIGGDLDRYSVTLEAGKFYTFKVAGGSDGESGYTTANYNTFGEMDTRIYLRNSAGTVVAGNDDISFPNDLSSGLGFFATVSGTYYLDVTAYEPTVGGYVIDFAEVDLASQDPLQAIRWLSADNIDTVNVAGTPTAYVYFGAAGESFGETTTNRTYHGWNALEKAAVMQALTEFSKITGITYAETADINQAEFRLNTVTGPTPTSLTFGAYFYPQDTASYGAQQGIGIFNKDSGGWSFVSGGIQPALLQGGFSFATILHEFGHAHGLAHPHDNGGGSDVMLGVTGSQGSLGLFNLNQGVYTVMSYNDAWWLHPDGHYGGPADPTRVGGLTGSNIDNGWSATLSAFDIAVLQERYGVHAYNATDTVYTLSDVVNAANYQTIWDSGGTDTISYGGGLNATIDLTAATLDYTATGAGVVSFVIDPAANGVAAPVLALRGGYTIANGVVIENATGGDGNDSLIGNAAANVLTGNFGNDTMVGREGNDTMNGGLGNDTARYFANRADYTINAVITNGQITGFTIRDDVAGNGNDGTDTLTGMETAQFNDVSVALTGAVAVFDADGDLVSVHTTIQAAINAATTLDGYRIFVSRGVYAEDVNVTKDLTIQGANDGVAGTDAGRGIETEVRSFTITANGVTVDGVKVYGQFAHPNAPSFPSGVYVIGNNFSLVNSVLDGPATAQYGILTQVVTGLDIGNNLITNYPQGIYVSSGGSTGSIHDNSFQGDGPGSGSGLQNGVLSESTLLVIQDNIFNNIDGGSFFALPQGPADTVDLLDIFVDNVITNSGIARPVQIYPSTLTPNVLGTNFNEAFVGDWGGLAGIDLSYEGRGGDDRAWGDSGNDSLSGDDGQDQLFGNAGGDTLNGGDGNDLLDGGADIDTAEFAEMNLTYIDTALGWLITSAEGNDFLQNVEIVDAGGERNLLVGSTGFANIQAALNSAENDDTIRLAAGTYTGTWNYSDTGLTVIAQPNAQINGTFTPSATQGIEVIGANLADSITTGAGSDILRGDGGNDTLSSGGGTDFLVGGAGADAMTGGAGDDTYYVDDAGDTAIEAVGGGNDRVAATVSYALNNGSEVEVLEAQDLSSANDLNLTGNDLANRITGNDGINVLRGLGGNDVMSGGGGNDFLVGGAGADTMSGDAGNDTFFVDDATDIVYEGVGQGNDRVAVTVSYTLAGGQEVEHLEAEELVSTSALNLTGNELANGLLGNNGANTLDGKGGNDSLQGLGGADVFAFTSALGAGNVDTIVDFGDGADKIGLDDAIFAGIGTPGAFNANAFRVGTAALDADDRIIYNGNQLFYDADGNGAGAAVLFATVNGTPALTASDFTVI